MSSLTFLPVLWLLEGWERELARHKISSYDAYASGYGTVKLLGAPLSRCLILLISHCQYIYDRTLFSTLLMMHSCLLIVMLYRCIQWGSVSVHLRPYTIHRRVSTVLVQLTGPTELLVV
jgi:hypothetical protein